MALTTGVRAAATARTSDSLLKGRRSSTLPPPRVMTMTSTSSITSSSNSASVTSRTALAPCTATSRMTKSAAGHRSRALTTTSCSASLLRPQMSPIRLGRKGKGFLRSGANSPSAASVAWSCARRASNSPRPTARIDRARSCKLPRPDQNSGRAQTMTRWPASRGGSMRPTSSESATTLKDTSASVSRSTRNCIRARGRSRYSATSPSTQIAPSFPIHSPSIRETVRTGTGESGPVSSAMAGA